MVKINKHIEIARSSRPWLSSMSQVSCDAIFESLSKTYASVGVSIVDSPEDLDKLVALKPDLVFVGLKYVPKKPAGRGVESTKIWVTEFLDQHGIVYTGSGHTAHALELNKHLAKQKVIDAGFSTSPFYVIKQNHSGPSTTALNYPVFIKPTSLGGGLGIDSFSVAHTNAELRSKVRSLSVEFKSDALIEQYLPGREFSVAILKNQLLPGFTTMPLELIAPLDGRGQRLLSEQVKSADTEQFLPVANSKLRTEITNLALSVFKTLGGRDYGRIDIRLNAGDEPFFLEANLLPSLIDGYGNFPKACLLNIGLSYESMLLQIVELALNRNHRMIKFPSAPKSGKNLGLRPSMTLAPTPD